MACSRLCKRYLLCSLCLMFCLLFYNNDIFAAEKQPTKEDYFENKDSENGGFYYAIVIDKVVYEYNPKTEEYTVVAFDRNHGKIKNGTTIRLLSQIKGKPVTAILIGEWDSPRGMVNLIIPNSIKSIVLDENWYRSLTIPDSIKPENIKVIGGYIDKIIFSGIHKKIGGIGAVNDIKTLEIPQTTKTIMANTFIGFEDLKYCVLPEGLEYIGSEAFAACGKLCIYVPASVKKIGKNAFGKASHANSSKTKHIRMMYCVKNSVAHKYAKKNHIPYTLVKSKKTTKYKVSSVTVNKSTITLKVGKSKTLTYSVNPFYADNTKVRFKSSNPKVATVDAGGKVKALKKGTATITIKAKDGSGKKAKVMILVKK